MARQTRKVTATASSLLGTIHMAVSGAVIFLRGQIQGGLVYPIVYVVSGTRVPSVTAPMLLQTASAATEGRLSDLRQCMPAHSPGGRRHPPRVSSSTRAIRKPNGSSKRRTTT